MMWQVGTWVSCPLGWGPVVETRDDGRVLVNAMDLSIGKVMRTWWDPNALFALTDKEIESMRSSDSVCWTENADRWLAVVTDALKECVLRVCVTTFVCRRLPQGMPVSPEDAKSLSREARAFLKTLFREVEHGSKKVSSEEV